MRGAERLTVFVWAGLWACVGVGVRAHAATAAALGANPTECEIQAALLGAAGAGCPPVPKGGGPPVLTGPVQPATVPPAPEATSPVPPPSALVAQPVPDAPSGLAASFLIHFDFASSRIRPASRALLDRIAAVMAAPQAAGVRFRIVGHTDAVGGEAANLALSRRRAAAVKEYLVSVRGVAASRLETDGRGEAEPADPADPAAAANRRVEIVNLGR